jgi:hypothetical protein
MPEREPFRRWIQKVEGLIALVLDNGKQALQLLLREELHLP